MLINLLLQQPLIFLVAIVAAIVAFTIHEFAHALAATLLGDSTAKDEKRLSLNPFVHLDVVGFALLLMSGFGWTKPVPFNPYALRTRFGGTLLIPLAGPIANVIGTIVAAFLLHHTYLISFFPGALSVEFLKDFLFINILLALFNCVPIPPLDGSRIVLSFFSDRFEEWKVHIERMGPFFLILLIIIDVSSNANFFSGFIQSIQSFIDAYLS